MKLFKKSIDKKVESFITGDILRWFCVENANNIVGCDWYKTHFCLKNCKFYNDKEEEIKDAIKRTKYWSH